MDISVKLLDIVLKVYSDVFTILNESYFINETENRIADQKIIIFNNFIYFSLDISLSSETFFVQKRFRRQKKVVDIFISLLLIYFYFYY